MNEYPELYNESYVLYDRVMNPLAAQLERKTRKDRGTRIGRHYTSSSTFDQPSLSHLNDDDDDGNDEGTSRASSPSLIRYVNLVFLKFFKTHLTLTPTWNHFTPFKLKSSTVKSKFEMSIVLDHLSHLAYKLLLPTPSIHFRVGRAGGIFSGWCVCGHYPTGRSAEFPGTASGLLVGAGVLLRLKRVGVPWLDFLDGRCVVQA
ncbi:hypothetical protein Tco_0295725 [Tanacetum coccineum]